MNSKQTNMQQQLMFDTSHNLYQHQVLALCSRDFETLRLTFFLNRWFPTILHQCLTQKEINLKFILSLINLGESSNIEKGLTRAWQWWHLWQSRPIGDEHLHRRTTTNQSEGGTGAGLATGPDQQKDKNKDKHKDKFNDKHKDICSVHGRTVIVHSVSGRMKENADVTGKLISNNSHVWSVDVWKSLSW